MQFEFETFQVIKGNNVAKLILNRPKKKNAISRKMMEELIVAIPEIAQDDDVRVFIITGAGSAFCAGADIDLMPGGRDVKDLSERNVEILRRSFVFQAAKKMILGLRRMEKPTIAMINGPCVGAGFDLALACDLRTASETAKFMCGFVKIGLFPGFGATWFYPRLMGLAKGMQMLFTGDIMSAKEAKEIGMINTLAPSQDLEAVTLSLAKKIAAGPPIAIRLMKEQVYKGLITDLESALDVAALCESITLASTDHLEGLAAKRENRSPCFFGT